MSCPKILNLGGGDSGSSGGGEQTVTIVDGQIDIDLSLGSTIHADLTSDCIINTPTNPTIGVINRLYLTQDATGLHEIGGYGSTPTLTPIGGVVFDVESPVASISGSGARRVLTFDSSQDLSGVGAGDFLFMFGASNNQNSAGLFPITAIDDVSDTIDFTHPNDPVNEADTTFSRVYVVSGRCKFDDRMFTWISPQPNKTTMLEIVYDGTNLNVSEGKTFSRGIGHPQQDGLVHEEESFNGTSVEGGVYDGASSAINSSGTVSSSRLNMQINNGEATGRYGYYSMRSGVRLDWGARFGFTYRISVYSSCSTPAKELAKREIGLSTDYSSDLTPENYLGFLLDCDKMDPTWKCLTRASTGGDTLVDTNIRASTVFNPGNSGTARFVVRADGLAASFFVNGIYVASISTNMPVGSLYEVIRIFKTNQASPDDARDTDYALEDVVVRNGTTDQWLYECTTAGTSGSSSPVWPLVDGATVADGTVVWTCRDITSDANTYLIIWGAARRRHNSQAEDY